MWRVPHFVGMTAAIYPVIQNHSNCGKSGHRNRAISMTGFSTSEKPKLPRLADPVPLSG
jgi:hypothetical protein